MPTVDCPKRMTKTDNSNREQPEKSEGALEGDRKKAEKTENEMIKARAECAVAGPCG